MAPKKSSRKKTPKRRRPGRPRLTPEERYESRYHRRRLTPYERARRGYSNRSRFGVGRPLARANQTFTYDTRLDNLITALINSNIIQRPGRGGRISAAQPTAAGQPQVTPEQQREQNKAAEENVRETNRRVKRRLDRDFEAAQERGEVEDLTGDTQTQARTDIPGAAPPPFVFGATPQPVPEYGARTQFPERRPSVFPDDPRFFEPEPAAKRQRRGGTAEAAYPPPPEAPPGFRYPDINMQFVFGAGPQTQATQGRPPAPVDPQPEPRRRPVIPVRRRADDVGGSLRDVELLSDPARARSAEEAFGDDEGQKKRRTDEGPEQTVRPAPPPAPPAPPPPPISDAANIVSGIVDEIVENVVTGKISEEEGRKRVQEAEGRRPPPERGDGEPVVPEVTTAQTSRKRTFGAAFGEGNMLYPDAKRQDTRVWGRAPDPTEAPPSPTGPPEEAFEAPTEEPTEVPAEEPAEVQTEVQDEEPTTTEGIFSDADDDEDDEDDTAGMPEFEEIGTDDRQVPQEQRTDPEFMSADTTNTKPERPDLQYEESARGEQERDLEAAFEQGEIGPKQRARVSKELDKAAELGRKADLGDITPETYEQGMDKVIGSLDKKKKQLLEPKVEVQEPPVKPKKKRIQPDVVEEPPVKPKKKRIQPDVVQGTPMEVQAPNNQTNNQKRKRDKMTSEDITDTEKFSGPYQGVEPSAGGNNQGMRLDLAQQSIMRQDRARAYKGDVAAQETRAKLRRVIQMQAPTDAGPAEVPNTFSQDRGVGDVSINVQQAPDGGFEIGPDDIDM